MNARFVEFELVNSSKGETHVSSSSKRKLKYTSKNRFPVLCKSKLY
jgi:hypothetical protein